MQGRLIKKFHGRYQAHPMDDWEKEFKIANQHNLGNIEFIIDFYKPELNPLLNFSGNNRIKMLEKKYKVKVYSICADYFMSNPIHSMGKKKNYSLEFLKVLIVAANKLGITNIILPCVDQSTISNNKLHQKNLIKNILSLKKLLEINKVNLLLETDLPPNKIRYILNKLNFKYFGINYDTGNSASLNYKISEEFKVYGKSIKEIHIKDRLLNGKSIRLGKGNMDFKLFFHELKKLNYKGKLIFQPYRDNNGKKIFFEQYDWFLKKAKEYL